MSSQAAVICLAVLCILMFAAHFWRQGRISFSDPAFFVFILFAQSVIFKIIYVYGFRPPSVITNLGFRTDRMFMGKPHDVLLDGMMFITLCLTAYLVGLQSRFSLSLPGSGGWDRTLDPASIQKIAAVIILLSLAGLLAFLNMTGGIESGRLFEKKFNDLPGGTTQRFYYPEYWMFKASTLVKCAFYALLIVWLARGERGSWAFYALLLSSFALTVLIYGFAGNRATSLLFLAEFMVLWALRPTARSARLYATFAAVLVLVITITSISRYGPVMAEVEQEAVIWLDKDAADPNSKAARKARKWKPHNLSLANWQRLEVLAQGRYGFDVIKTAHFIDQVPSKIPYFMGETFIGWPFVVVPASLWPDKPVFATLPSMLSDKIFLQPENNIPPSVVGESYLNFGWFGVLVLGLVGLLTAFVANTIKANAASSVVLVLGAIVLTRLTIIMFATSFGDAILKIALDVLPTALLLAASVYLGKVWPNRPDDTRMPRTTVQ